MNPQKKVVYLSDGHEPRDEDMKFRLTYRGPLRSTQNDPKPGQPMPESQAKHKHVIRQNFHAQLKELWKTNRFLYEHRMDGKNGEMVPMSEALARRYTRNGYRFVPLVFPEASLFCSLDVLFLRRDIPGSVIQAGDLDNRLKTLIDALRMPTDASELVKNEAPQEGEDPFFVLLQDDKQVTHFSVESDTLLDVPKDSKDGAFVELIITVSLRPYDVTMFNLSFA